MVNNRQVCWCIFFWDMNDNVEQVQLDSVWTDPLDAKDRMETILKSENDFIQKTYPNMNELGENTTPIRAELLYQNGSNECVIKHMCKDGHLITTEGIFCQQVPLNRYSFLYRKADQEHNEEEKEELNQRESDYEQMEVLDEEIRQTELDAWYQQLEDELREYSSAYCDQFGTKENF